MASKSPTDGVLPQAPTLDVEKYRIDSDADSEDAENRYHKRPVAGPMTDAEEAARKAKEEEEEAAAKKAAEQKSLEDAAAAEEEAAAAAFRVVRDSDSDEDDVPSHPSHDENDGVEAVNADVAVVSATAPDEDEKKEEVPATVSVSQTTGGEVPETAAASGEHVATGKKREKTKKTKTEEKKSAKKVAAKATADAPAVETQREMTKGRRTAAALESPKKERKPKKKVAGTTADTEVDKKAKPTTAPASRGGARSPPEGRVDKTKTKTKSKAKTTTADGKKKNTEKSTKALSAKAQKPRKWDEEEEHDREQKGEEEENPEMAAAGDMYDARKEAAHRSHQKRREEKEAALAASDVNTVSSGSGSGAKTGAGGVRGTAKQWASARRSAATSGIETIPGVIRRSVGGPGGLHAVGAEKDSLSMVSAPIARHSVDDHHHHPNVNSASKQTATEPPQRRVLKATRTVRTADDDGFNLREKPPQQQQQYQHSPLQRRTAPTGCTDSDVGSREPSASSGSSPFFSNPHHGNGSGGLEQHTADPAALQALLLTLENATAVKNGEASVRYVDPWDLPPLPPALLRCIVAHYETCLLQLPFPEVERVVVASCLCPGEKDRKSVMSYLREKQKMLLRQQHRERTKNIAQEAEKAERFAASAGDASMRGLAGENASPSGLFAARIEQESDNAGDAVSDYKRCFTQQSGAAFLEEQVEACIARRQRYYDNQPALVRAKKVVVEERLLLPMYRQCVNALLYQALGLCEAECLEKNFTEPVVMAVMSRLPPVSYDNDEKEENEKNEENEENDKKNDKNENSFEDESNSNNKNNGNSNADEDAASDEEKEEKERVEAAANDGAFQSAKMGKKGETGSTEDAAFVPYADDGEEEEKEEAMAQNE